MYTPNVCGTCAFFNGIHEICRFLGTTRIEYERRQAISPACHEGYMRKREPKELTRLFERNQMPPQWSKAKESKLSLFSWSNKESDRIESEEQEQDNAV